MKTAITILENMIAEMNKKLNSMKSDYWKKLHDWAMAQEDHSAAEEVADAEVTCLYYNLKDSYEKLGMPGVDFYNINFAGYICDNIHEKYKSEHGLIGFTEISHDEIEIFDSDFNFFKYVNHVGWIHDGYYHGTPDEDTYSKFVGTAIFEYFSDLENEFAPDPEFFSDYCEWDDEDDDNFGFLDYDDCGFCEE